MYFVGKQREIIKENLTIKQGIIFLGLI